MIFKKKEFFLLIFLILLQSCSGGRIGNFLESSFNDLEEISQDEDLQKNLINKKNLVKENKEIDDKKNKKIKKVEKPKNVLENKKDKNLEKLQKQKNNKIKNSSKKRIDELQSYKIIFILKDVDPKDPTKELSTILKNSKVNFEIEKIERILDSKNKIKEKNLAKLQKGKNNKIKNSSKKRKIELQSYKIIFILKDVDPKDPTEELSTILSNSEVNFEIEKIERILDSKNKTINKN